MARTRIGALIIHGIGERGYWNPLRAHLAYWNDPTFYGLAAVHWLA